MDKTLELMQFDVSYDADCNMGLMASIEPFITLRYKVLDRLAVGEVTKRGCEVYADKVPFLVDIDAEFGDDIAQLVAAGRSVEPVRIRPTRVIVNQPAVIVFFSDSTKVVSQARETDDFDLAMGLLVSCFKKVVGRRWMVDDVEWYLATAAEIILDCVMDPDSARCLSQIVRTWNFLMLRKRYRALTAMPSDLIEPMVEALDLTAMCLELEPSWQ